MQTDAATLKAGTKNQSGLIVRSFSLKLFLVLLGLLAVLTAIHLSLQYLNLVVYQEKHGFIFELSNRFDFDDEASLPTWFSQAIFLSISVSALLAAYIENSKPRRRLWQIIGVTGVIVAIDEIMGFHEAMLQGIHTYFFGDSNPSVFENSWWVILPFVIAVGVWILAQMFKYFPRKTINNFIAGTVIYLIGSVGVDILANSTSKATFLSQGILVAVEETLEIIGGLIFLFAVVDFLETRHKAKIRQALKQLKS